MYEFVYDQEGSEKEPDSDRKACIDCIFMQGAAVSIFCVSEEAKKVNGPIWNCYIRDCQFWKPMRTVKEIQGKRVKYILSNLV